MLRDLVNYLWNLSWSLYKLLEATRIGRAVDSQEFWEKFADTFIKRVEEDPGLDRYTAWQLSRIELSPQDVVLDLGCGFGRLTIPIAKRCKLVYAVDQCEKLLRALRERAEKEGVIDRIVIINKRWEQLQPGVDIPERVDVVIISHSLEVEDLVSSLSFVDRICTKCVHIFIDVLPLLFIEYMTVCRELFRNVCDLYPSPAGVVYLALTSIGVNPQVEIYVRKVMFKISSIDQFIQERASRIFPVDKDECRRRLAEVLSKCVEKVNGQLTLKLTRPIAHIWWCKRCI